MTFKNQNQSVESIKDQNLKCHIITCKVTFVIFLAEHKYLFQFSGRKKNLKVSKQKGKENYTASPAETLTISLSPFPYLRVLPCTDFHNKTVTDFNRNKNIYTPRQKMPFPYHWWSRIFPNVETHENKVFFKSQF